MVDNQGESRRREDPSGTGDVTEGLGHQFELDQMRHTREEEAELAEHPDASGEVTEGLGRQFELDRLKQEREESAELDDR